MPNLVLGVPVSPVEYGSAVQQILDWSRRGESRYVCVANVHSLMEAFDSVQFCRVLAAADMVVPDGMPIVWMMRLKGCRRHGRVYGPALMEAVLHKAAEQGIAVGLYGSTEGVVRLLEDRLARDYPELRLAFRASPPFAELRELAVDQAPRRIEESGARILFVGLGCPKQERWMAAQRGELPAVMIGVGAAFDFLAGTKRQAPRWMQSIGLEWLFRLLSEPGRLWKRYAFHNPRFMFLAAAELLGIWRRRC
jgi:N-acetylglucosaminyldiphosphoundecaprenol N-acetyl-beta-D-mannosaminyltransferase